MTPGHQFGELACEYKHPKFRKGRRDLLEQISRQPSSAKQLASEDSHSTAAQYAPLLQAGDKARIEGHLDSLEQGQRLSFYQIKDLERRIDFFERELGSCRYIVESQTRIIKDLLTTIPQESRQSHPELSNLASELQHTWHEPAFDPYPYHPSNYRQSYHNSQLPIDPNVSTTNNASSTPSVNSANGNGNGHIIGVAPSVRVGSDGSGNGSGSAGVVGNSSNGSNVATFVNEVHPSHGAGFTSTNGPIQNHLPFPNRQENLPFNNQPQPQLGGWNSAIFDEIPRHDISGNPVDIQNVASKPDSFHALNILVLVCHSREQHLISDILIELQCLSFKFAVDMSHVFHCLEGRRDYNVLFLDKIYESNSLLIRLRLTNPTLMVIFLAEQQEPTPPMEDPITHTLLKPPTARNLQEVLSRYIERDC